MRGEGNRTGLGPRDGRDGGLSSRPMRGGPGLGHYAKPSGFRGGRGMRPENKA